MNEPNFWDDIIKANQTNQELSLLKKEVNIYRCETLEQTVKLAKEIAFKGDVVLFSPASASFDMFKNFDERGKKFKELVVKLV